MCVCVYIYCVSMLSWPRRCMPSMPCRPRLLHGSLPWPSRITWICFRDLQISKKKKMKSAQMFITFSKNAQKSQVEKICSLFLVFWKRSETLPIRKSIFRSTHGIGKPTVPGLLEITSLQKLLDLKRQRKVAESHEYCHELCYLWINQDS